MKLIEALTDAGDGGGGNVVAVGVKFDAQSRELLTWALVKAAQPGDHIIAFHVLDAITDSTASLISLVKTFDSMLGVYEGFCNLKQVDLKLKVCRGTSVRKILVSEAKSCGAATVIVGTSKTHQTIRSSYSVAKYCARKLPKDFSVFAIDNGKIVFQREATMTRFDNSQDNSSHKKSVHLVHQSLNKNLKASKATEELNQESRNCSHKSRLNGGGTKKKFTSCTTSELPHNSNIQLLEELPEDDSMDNSLALVPIQRSETDLGSKQKNLDRSSKKKISVAQWVLRFPGWHSTSVLYPDPKHSRSNQEEDCSSCLDGDDGAIVPFGFEATCPLSPFNGLNNFPKELQGLHEMYSSTCRLFSYQELLLATSNFLPENMVGKGGSSYVYRGCLPDGKELAVKILKPSADVLKEFVLEIDIITSLHHKNIISLYGLCFEDNNLLLVYDFLSRGSLEENLYGNKKDANAFSWPERYKVAIGVAEALDYLHSGCDRSVIHRDVKSSNILLSDDFEPQLSDFGLASWASNSSSHRTCTDVAGTFGYFAPEYFMHGKVTDKIDVYAFGVVLLELLSGRKPISSEYPKGQESLVMWAKQILKGGKFSQLLDPSLGSNYDDNQIERMVFAATLCIRRAPRLRPQISLVLKLLQGDVEVTNWARLFSASEELDVMDGEVFPTNIQSHLNLALLDLEDDSLSISSPEQSVSIEDYLQGRWSCSSSYD